MPEWRPKGLARRAWRGCQCGIWVQGSLGGEWVKRSLNTRDWRAAAAIVHGWETSGQIALPFEDADIERILAAAETLTQWGSFGPKIRAMVLLLRYSGLRMQGAACLERARLKNGKLFLYTQKTGTPVYCPLPPTAATALEGVSNTHPDYFFWDGRSERETTVKSWNRVFRKVFSATDPPIQGGHPHRFRDTFAVSLLLKGVELSHVSILLGHASVKLTERHYAPWVKARQEQLEADVERTWASVGNS